MKYTPRGVFDYKLRTWSYDKILNCLGIPPEGYNLKLKSQNTYKM